MIVVTFVSAVKLVTVCSTVVGMSNQSVGTLLYPYWLLDLVVTWLHDLLTFVIPISSVIAIASLHAKLSRVPSLMLLVMMSPNHFILNPTVLMSVPTTFADMLEEKLASGGEAPAGRWCTCDHLRHLVAILTVMYSAWEFKLDDTRVPQGQIRH